VNASPTQIVFRAAGIMLIVVLAAAAGLAAGNFLQQVRGEESITAQASFSRDALDELSATRDDRPAAAAYPDYAIRHAPTNAALSDWALRHRMLPAPTTTTYRLTGPSDVEARAATTTSDTFRLTGPSDPGTELRGQRRAN
jgi:hypothetical protein